MTQSHKAVGTILLKNQYIFFLKEYSRLHHPPGSGYALSYEQVSSRPIFDPFFNDDHGGARCRGACP